VVAEWGLAPPRKHDGVERPEPVGDVVDVGIFQARGLEVGSKDPRGMAAIVPVRHPQRETRLVLVHVCSRNGQIRRQSGNQTAGCGPLARQGAITRPAGTHSTYETVVALVGRRRRDAAGRQRASNRRLEHLVYCQAIVAVTLYASGAHVFPVEGCCIEALWGGSSLELL
jgi:hypothetical protein